MRALADAEKRAHNGLIKTVARPKNYGRVPKLARDMLRVYDK